MIKRLTNVNDDIMNQVESCLVRIKDAGHALTARQSNQVYKVMYTLAWFDKYKEWSK